MITNLSRNTVLVERFRVADSFIEKFVGLMFSTPRPEGLLFSYPSERFISLHMFFVFYPIDVLWLNSEKEVVFVKKNFLPFTCVFPPVKAQYVLELPKGTIQESQTTVGDVLEIPGVL